MLDGGSRGGRVDCSAAMRARAASSAEGEGSGSMSVGRGREKLRLARRIWDLGDRGGGETYRARTRGRRERETWLAWRRDAMRSGDGGSWVVGWRCGGAVFGDL